jgi:hypothetical protein
MTMMILQDGQLPLDQDQDEIKKEINKEIRGQW